MHYILFVPFFFLLQASSIHSKRVVTNEKEVENTVMAAMNDRWKGIPPITKNYKTRNPLAVVVKHMVEYLFRNYGVCGLLYNVKLSFCNLALQEGENYDQKGYAFTESTCHKQPVHFSLKHEKMVPQDTGTWMFICPHISFEEPKRYYLGTVDGFIDRMIVYQQNMGGNIVPVRVIYDITIEDLLGFGQRTEHLEDTDQKQAEDTHPEDAENTNPKNIENTDTRDTEQSMSSLTVSTTP